MKTWITPTKKQVFFILVVTAIVSVTNYQSLAQENFKKNVLDQIDTIIYYSPQILGKTFYQFYSHGRPKGFSDKQFTWEMTIIDPEKKGEYEKLVRMKWIADSFIFFNSSTHLSYVIEVNPNIWVSADELHSYLKEKYGLDERGFSYLISVADKKYAFFQFDIRDNIPRVMIFSAGPDGKALYFK